MLEVELAWCGAGGPCSEQAGKLQTYLDYMFMKSNFSLNIFMSGSVMTESAVDHETDTFAHSRDQTSHTFTFTSSFMPSHDEPNFYRNDDVSSY